jgi:hypothetical protein
MRIYNMPRQSGKTTMLIDWLRLDEKHILIVHSATEASRLRRDYEEVADQIVSVSFAQSGGLMGRHGITVAVDNLDLILPFLLGVYGNAIGPITYTGEYSYGN